MSDLQDVLPNFNVTPYTRLLYSLQKNEVNVSDLLTLDPIEIAKKCNLPPSEVRKLVVDVVAAMQKEVGIGASESNLIRDRPVAGSTNSTPVPTHLITKTLREPDLIKTLDSTVDEALGGGIHTGYVTEVVGESSAGKTQFVLGLLLSTQVDPPQGLSRSAIYISTEAPLNTTRLHQMLATHPTYTTLPASARPSLNNIYAIPVNDLEAQEHIIEYQLQLAVKKYSVGLVVMDSVAANFRAEYETKTAEGMADRAMDLAKLGRILRTIAIEDNVAVVVTNQVSDRFDNSAAISSPDLLRSSSPAGSSSPALDLPQAPPPTPAPHLRQPAMMSISANMDEIMSLDHQQRFFSGWGDVREARSEAMKTPALGFVWTNQISARIVLKMEGERLRRRPAGYQGGNIWSDRKRRRYLSVVFAPWVAATEKPVEYEIKTEGIVSVHRHAETDSDNPHAELLDPELWGIDGPDEDEEFP